MATYRSIVGQKIKKVTSDPSNPIEGQMWYNSTSGNLKVKLTVAGSWAASNNFPDTRRAGYSTGTQTATIYAGGYDGSGGSASVDTTKSYNGTSWSSGPTFYEQKFLGGTAGTQTAAITFCGNGPAGANRNTAGAWNGSSWTSGPTVPVGNQGNVGFGTSTAAVTCGGSADYDFTGEWDGSSWTAVNNLNTDRYSSNGAGTLTAGLASGGQDSPGTTLSTSSSYDGTNWTAGSALTEAKRNMYGMNLASAGVSGALLVGGRDASSVTTNCQVFDGTSYSNTGVLGTGRDTNVSGSSTSGLASAGYNGSSNVNNTEEFTGAALATKTVTTS